jgi:hypothetical protein
MISLISSLMLMPSNCLNAHFPAHQLYITLLRCNQSMNSKNCKNTVELHSISHSM